MSKAFDTVKRDTLLQELKTVLDEDEVHIMKILMKDVKLVVRMGKSVGEEIVTNIGVPQGDCCSPILFTLYLAKALEKKTSSREDHEDHTYYNSVGTVEDLLRPELKDHIYSLPQDYGLLIDQQYADDTGWVGVNCKHKIEEVKKVVPEKLKRSNLMVNAGKTEEYSISSDGDPAWKKCKYLGSLLDSQEDIKRRKSLAVATYNKLKHVLENRKTSRCTKMRIHKVYIESVMLYNSELWTMSKKMEDSIDVFQRNLFRRSLNISWKDKITNKELYNKTGLKPYSTTVKNRRLKWFGHMCRLPEETPVRIAYSEATRKVKKLKGGQKLTWPKTIEKDLQNSKVDLKQAQILAQDRCSWNAFTSRLMSNEDGRSD